MFRQALPGILSVHAPSGKVGDGHFFNPPHSWYHRTVTSRRRSVGVPLRRRVLIVAARLMLLLAGASLLLAAVISARLVIGSGWPWPHGDQALGPLVAAEPPATPAYAEPPVDAPPAPGPTVPDILPVPTDTPSVSPTAPPLSTRVGIVAGHSGYDPGAVCPDGLTEAEVNMAVARIVVESLQQLGYQVDLLEEFDARLTGYRADALVSIHADSCEVPGASGFKVARVTHSAIPEAEDRLVECLYREYEATTGLPRHPNSITDNMTNYHAFHEIHSLTPGAIIETGFLLEDHAWIVRRPRLVAHGIVNGVLCFLSAEELP
jgi:N-acetylmuramoyl-L-alanine amidase